MPYSTCKYIRAYSVTPFYTQVKGLYCKAFRPALSGRRPPSSNAESRLESLIARFDNLFLRSYASLKGKSVRLTGTLVLLAVLPLVAVLALSLGLGYVKLKQDIASQTDAVGQELARQVAASVAEPMAANDNLSLNIILAQWTKTR